MGQHHEGIPALKRQSRHLVLLLSLFIVFSAYAADQMAEGSPAGPRDLGAVLCLGDSVTECRGDSGTWRHGLWRELVLAGYRFDFIGTQGRGDCPRSVTPDVNGLDFDTDHEGHGGWTTEDILHGKRDAPEERLEQWLKKYTPDTVLIHLGGNDVKEARSKPWAVLGLVERAQENLKAIIRLIQSDNPNATIYLALHIKANGDQIPFANGALAVFNSGLPKIARELSTPESRIILVDHYSSWENALLEEDGIHPNAEGNARMAATWFKTIHEGPQSISLQGPLAGCAPDCTGGAKLLTARAGAARTAE